MTNWCGTAKKCDYHSKKKIKERKNTATRANQKPFWKDACLYSVWLKRWCNDSQKNVTLKKQNNESKMKLKIIHQIHLYYNVHH